MGRSVMTLSGATVIAYATFEPSHYCDECEEWHPQGETLEACQEAPYSCCFGCDHSEEFGDYLEWVRDTVRAYWPSMDSADSWVGNELHTVAESRHSIVTVSEYMDCVAICLGANYDRQNYYADDSQLSGMGEQWRKSIAPKFLATFGTMTRIATMSNGESVYARN